MDSQGGSMDSMLPVPVNTTEEIRRIVKEELHRRNRPASINCFERTQTLIRGAATAVRRNINSQTVSSSPAGNGSTSSSTATAFRSGIASPVNNNYQQSTTSLMRYEALGEQAVIKEEEIQTTQVATYTVIIISYCRIYSWLAITIIANGVGISEKIQTEGWRVILFSPPPPSPLPAPS